MRNLVKHLPQSSGFDLKQLLVEAEYGQSIISGYRGYFDWQPGLASDFINGAGMRGIKCIGLRAKSFSGELAVDDAPGVSAVGACHLAR